MKQYRTKDGRLHLVVNSRRPFRKDTIQDYEISLLRLGLLNCESSEQVIRLVEKS